MVKRILAGHASDGGGHPGRTLRTLLYDCIVPVGAKVRPGSADSRREKMSESLVFRQER
jgi:hypothetical protein